MVSLQRWRNFVPVLNRIVHVATVSEVRKDAQALGVGGGETLQVRAGSPRP